MHWLSFHLPLVCISTQSWTLQERERTVECQVKGAGEQVGLCKCKAKLCTHLATPIVVWLAAIPVGIHKCPC